jgi:hypothetical protein
MPYRRRKRWVRHISRWKAVQEKELGSNTVVYNKSLSVENTTSGEQLVRTICLYSLDSTVTELNDLNKISTINNTSDPTDAAGINVDDSTKIIFTSGVLDVTMRNTSHINETPTTVESDTTLETDVYEIRMRKKALQNSTSYNNFEDLLNAFTTPTVGTQTTSVNISKRGATPFDMNYALSRYGIKVLKKTKFFIRGGQTVTYQLRDSRRYARTIKGLAQEHGFNQPGMTKIIFIIAKVIPGFTVGSTAGLINESLQIGITRKYQYKIEGQNQDRSTYLTN